MEPDDEGEDVMVVGCESSQGRIGIRPRLMSGVAALAVALFGLATQGAAQSAQPPIRVGALVSLTGGGAINGYNDLAGVKMAIGEINAKGGVGGRNIELVIADDQSDPTMAVNEARRLASSEKVDLVIGPLSSQLTLAVVPIFNEAKLAQISTSGSSLLTPEFTPYGFSMNPSAENQAELMVQQVTKGLASKNTAVLMDNGAQTKSGFGYIKGFLEKSDTKIAAVQEFPFRSEDKTPQLLSLRSSGADSLMIWANTTEDFASILNNLQEIGWNVKMSGAIAETMFAPPVSKLAPKDYIALVASVAYRGWTYCPGDKVDDLPFVQFKRRLLDIEKNHAKDLAPTIAAWGYDAMYIFKAAIEGGAKNGPEIASWIEKNSSTVPAVSGQLAASPKTHFLVGAAGMTMVDDLAKPGPEDLYRRTDCAAK
jgi:branched-chain amino acid transport system substrate-binding protein